jgi:hypothetical protein
LLRRRVPPPALDAYPSAQRLHRRHYLSLPMRATQFGRSLGCITIDRAARSIQQLQLQNALYV